MKKVYDVMLVGGAVFEVSADFVDIERASEAQFCYEFIAIDKKKTHTTIAIFPGTTVLSVVLRGSMKRKESSLAKRGRKN